MHCKDSSNPRTYQAKARRLAHDVRLRPSARTGAPAEITFPHPLSWWRTRRPERFKEVDIHIARYVLSKSAIIGESHWHLGAAGNVAVAINVARRANGRHSIISLDVAMTAVLCITLEGNTEAKLFLSAILSQRADVDQALGKLSDEWLDFTPPWI